MNNPGSKKNIVPIIAAVFLVAVALIGNLGIIAASANDASCTCGTLTDVHNFSCPLYSSPSAQSDAPTFEATLQSVLNATNAPIDLTAGVENLEWAYSASGSETFKLNIFLDNLEHVADGTYYRIILETDPAVYFSSISDAADLDWASSLTSTENAKVNINSTGLLTPLSYSGKYVYDIKTTQHSASLDLTLCYDWRFWDRSGESELGYYNGYTDIDKNLLSVKFVQVSESDGTETVINSGKLISAKPKEGEAFQRYARILVKVPDSETYLEGDSMNETYKARYRIRVGKDYLIKKCEFTIILPYCDVNGTRYSMLVDDEASSITSGSGNGKITPSIVEEKLDDGRLKVVITLENFFSSAKFIYLGVTMPFGEGDVATGNHVFSNGRASLKYNDQPIYENYKLGSVTLTDINVPNYELKGDGSEISCNAKEVVFFSTFGVNNTGGAETGDITIVNLFDVNNTNVIGVTSIRLLLPAGNTTIIKYSMVDENGNLKVEEDTITLTARAVTSEEDEATINSYGTVFSRLDLPTDQQNYYFKEVRYCINIPAGAVLSRAAGVRSGAGSVWGRIIDNTPKQTTAYHNFSIFSGDYANPDYTEESDPLLTYKPKTVVKDINTAPYMLENLKVSLSNGALKTEVSIDPGGNVTISGRIRIYEYPYSAKSDLNNIRIGILLPEGISIIENGIEAFDGNATSVAVNNVSSRKILNGEGAGQYYWIIEFDQTVVIGYYSDDLATLASGDRIDFSIPLVTELTTSRQDIVVNSIIAAAGLGQPNDGNGGNIKVNRVADTFGLLGDGFKNTDLVACVDNTLAENKKVKIHINQPKAILEISDSLKPVGGSASDVINTSSVTDSFVYELLVECTRGGSAKGFFYFIPIPKISVTQPDFVTNNYNLSMTLVDAARLEQSNANLDVLYAVEDGLTYDTAKLYEKWKTEEQITDWSTVTMIKILSHDGDDIGNGASIRLTLNYRFGSDFNYAKKTGATLFWQSKGYYEYILGSTINAGDRTTTGGTLRLMHTAQRQNITLTAAKDRSPQNGQNRSTNSLYEMIGIDGGFDLDHSFSVINVKTTLLTLVDSSDSVFGTMSSSDSNQKFKIMAQYATGEKTALMQAGIASFGTLSANTAVSPDLSFEIYNGNLITENVEVRYVSFDLVSDNGLTIPITIYVARELTPATPGTPGIIEGISYMLSEDDDTTVNVSSDSAVTARFVTEFVHKNYSCPSLKLTGLTAGKRIIMIDWTNSSDPEYYFAEMTPSISLESFKSITDQNKNYVYDSSDETSIKHTWVFIIDLSGSSLTAGKNVQLELVSGEQTFTDQSLSLTAKESRSFTLGTNAENGAATVGERIVFNYGSSGELSDSADYKYNAKGLSLVIYGRALPADFYIRVDGKAYYRNANGDFVIPLGTAQTENAFVTVASESSSLTSNVTLSAELWVSATADNLQPRGGEIVARTTVNVTPASNRPSVNVVSISDKLISSDELKNGLSIEIETLDTDDCRIWLNVQKKEGSGYVNRAAVVTSVTNAGQGVEGVFELDKTSSVFKLTFNNSENVQSGTYRIRIFVASDSDEEIATEVFVGFVVQ